MAESLAVRKGYTKGTSLAALNAATTMQTGGCPSATFGCFSVVTPNLQLSAEGRMSDTGPWYALHLMPTADLTPGTPLASTPDITALPTGGWRVDLQGMSQWRVRVSTWVAGSAIVEARLSDNAYS